MGVGIDSKKVKTVPSVSPSHLGAGNCGLQEGCVGDRHVGGRVWGGPAKDGDRGSVWRQASYCREVASELERAERRQYRLTILLSLEIICLLCCRKMYFCVCEEEEGGKNALDISVLPCFQRSGGLCVIWAPGVRSFEGRNMMSTVGSAF